MDDPRRQAPTSDAIEVRNAPERGRYEISVEGEPAGFATYRLAPGVVTLLHTEIDPRFQGRGLADRLIEGALEEIRGRDEVVVPYCPFVRAFIRRHPEYRPLVAATRPDEPGR